MKYTTGLVSKMAGLLLLAAFASAAHSQAFGNAYSNLCGTSNSNNAVDSPCDPSMDPAVQITNASAYTVNAVWYVDVDATNQIKRYEASLSPASTKTLVDGITYYAEEDSTEDKRNQPNKVLISASLTSETGTAKTLHSEYVVWGYSAADLEQDKKIKLLITISDNAIVFATDPPAKPELDLD